MANEMKYEPTKPGKPEDKPQEQKPEEPKPEGPGCFASFWHGITDLFGCLKNVEGAYTNAPPQITEHLPEQMQMPQQAPTQNPTNTTST